MGRRGAEGACWLAGPGRLEVGEAGEERRGRQAVAEEEERK